MRCEICKTRNVKLDKHHIHSKCQGGTNHLSNIANICPNCHRKVHCGDYIIEGKYFSTEGFVLFWHEKEADSILNQPLPPVYNMNQK